MVNWSDIAAPDAFDSWHWAATARLLLAAGLGAIIGAEREHHGRAAGLRTLILVSTGAALAMLVSLHFGKVFGVENPMTNVQIDPARVAYGVMTGVGFLGAGSIIRDQAGIRGLTTAASLWCTAAVGLAAGFGMILESAGATLILLLVLWALRKVDRAIPSLRDVLLTVEFDRTGTDHLEGVCKAMKSKRLHIKVASIHCDHQTGTETIAFDIEIPRQTPITEIVQACQDQPDVRRLTIE